MIPSTVLYAISATLGEAIEHTCSCDRKGNGYMGHSKTCWIHLNRAQYRRIMRFLAAAHQERETARLVQSTVLTEASRNDLA
jgi:hypothetical protein